MSANALQRPVPKANADTRAFWDAINDKNELTYQVCEDCGKVASYPRGVCAHCHSRRLAMRTSTGRGVVKTWTRNHRAATPAFKDHVPYVIAIIDVEEGFPVMVNITGEYANQVAIGDKVGVVVRDRGDGVKLLQAIPMYTWERFVPGSDLGTISEPVTAEVCEQWASLYPWDKVGADGLAPFGMTSVLMMRAYLMIATPRPPGNVHASQRFTVTARPRVGEVIESRLRVLSKTRKGERGFVEFELIASGEGGRALFTGVMTLIWAA